MQYDALEYLPTSEELPDSDETPVDNELQDSVPGLLKAILADIWQLREDWFFGIDLAVYYAPDEPAIAPDAFLSLGVRRFKSEDGRPSYVFWEENNVVPLLVLEVVSRTYRGEYGKKLRDYAELGVLYYAVYNPLRKRQREPLEVYKLVDGTYVRQPVEPVWMPEIGLALGRSQGQFDGWRREWLYWFDDAGRRLLGPDERLEQERQRADRLAAYLRSQGLDPDQL